MSVSGSLFDVGWHMETAAWKTFLPPSHLSSRILCTVSMVTSEAGSASRAATVLRTPSRSHCSIFASNSCGENERTITATSFFLPEPTCGSACVPSPAKKKS